MGLIETADLIIRSLAAGVMLTCLIAYHKVNPAPRKYWAAVVLTTINILFLVVASISFKSLVLASPNWLLLHSAVYSVFSVLAVWGFLEILDEAFKVRPWHFVVLFLSIVFYVLDYLEYPGPNGMIIPLFCWVYFISVAFRNNRLEFKTIARRTRVWFIGGIGVLGIVIVGQTASYGSMEVPNSYAVLEAFSVLIGIICLAFLTLNVKEGTLARGREMPSAPTMLQELSEPDRTLLRRLQTIMETDVWKEEGLTIGKLAKTLLVPEHRLRKVINNGLGHRNFTGFLNSYRIKAAKKILSNPDNAGLPIVNVAYDLGYASLGPFNRAFRDAVGTTPSDFRKHQLSQLD